jgi:hypothetical protein
MDTQPKKKQPRKLALDKVTVVNMDQLRVKTGVQAGPGLLTIGVSIPCRCAM